MNKHSNFSPASRVWVYQSNRAFTTDELSGITALLTQFTKQWTAHNQQLQAGFELHYNQFIVLMVDESAAGASGCSIDKSVHIMQQVEREFGVKLFDRWLVAYMEGDIVKTATRSQFEELLANGTITPDTIVFNNLISTLHELNTNWQIPFKKSWHAQVFA